MLPGLDFFGRNPQLIPWLLSSSAIGMLLGLKKFCGAIKTAILSGLAGLADIHQAFCDFISKCDANWCELKKEFAEHRRRDFDELIPKRGTEP